MSFQQDQSRAILRSKVVYGPHGVHDEWHVRTGEWVVSVIAMKGLSCFARQKIHARGDRKLDLIFQ